MISGTGTPVDWTNGAGVFPAGGTITITANPYRQGLYLQNLDTTAVLVEFAATESNSSTTACIATVPLTATASSGTAGGALNLGPAGFMVSGQITVIGTAGKQVVALTV